jgi:hypothetical protein
MEVLIKLSMSHTKLVFIMLSASNQTEGLPMRLPQGLMRVCGWMRILL